MIAAAEYIALAKELAQGETDAHRRRAVSTAYYAAFHAITFSLVSSLVPEDKTSLFERVYRKPEHKQFSDSGLLHGSDDVDFIRAAMKNLREEREKADYDFRPFDAPPEHITQLIDSAEQVIDTIGKLDAEARLHLAVNVLIVKPRDPSGSGQRKGAPGPQAQK